MRQMKEIKPWEKKNNENNIQLMLGINGTSFRLSWQHQLVTPSLVVMAALLFVSMQNEKKNKIKWESSIHLE